MNNAKPDGDDGFEKPPSGDTNGSGSAKPPTVDGKRDVKVVVARSLVPDAAADDPRVVDDDEMMRNVGEMEDEKTRDFLKFMLPMLTGKVKPPTDTSPIIQDEPDTTPTTAAPTSTTTDSATSKPAEASSGVTATAASSGFDVLGMVPEMESTISASIASGCVGVFGKRSGGTSDGGLRFPDAGSSVDLEFIQRLPVDWGWFETGALEGLPPDRPYPDDVVGRFLIIEDQFMRWYPPGLVVARHPNKFMIGVIWFESFDNDTNPNSVLVGADAFPSTNDADYENYDSDRIHLQPINPTPIVTPTAPKNASAASAVASAVDKKGCAKEDSGDGKKQVAGDGKKQVWRVHWLSGSWLRRLLYSENSQGPPDNPWQFQRFSARATPPTTTTIAAATPTMSTTTAATAAVGVTASAASAVKLAASAASAKHDADKKMGEWSVSALGLAESVERAKQSKTFCEVPPQMSGMMGFPATARLSDVAPSGRALTHSFPIPYECLTPTEFLTAHRLWERCRFPTLAPPPSSSNPTSNPTEPAANPIVSRSAAARKLLIQ